MRTSWRCRRPPARPRRWPHLVTREGTTTAPLISIVTVVRNARDVIEQTVCSVLDQKAPDVEYVVIDGASTDGTVDLLRRYHDRIDRWTSEPDGGISEAFNKGLAAARGAVIGLLNAGDWFEPGAIEAVRRARNPSEPLSVYHGDLAYHRADGTHAFDARPVPRDIWKYMSFYHPGMFVEREVYRRFGGYSPAFRYAMDAERVHRWVRAGVRFVYLPRIQAHMRLGGNSDRYYWRAFAEFRDSAILHGVPPLEAWARFGARTVKRAVRRLTGLHP